MKREKNDSDITLTRRAALKLAAAGTAAGILGLSSSDALGYLKKATVSETVSGPGHVVKVHMPGMQLLSFVCLDVICNAPSATPIIRAQEHLYLQRALYRALRLVIIV